MPVRPVDMVEKDNVPLPFVVSACPLEPSETFNCVIPTELSEGVTVPPTAPDISIINIEAPLAGAVLNVIDAPPLAKV